MISSDQTRIDEDVSQAQVDSSLPALNESSTVATSSASDSLDQMPSVIDVTSSSRQRNDGLQTIVQDDPLVLHTTPNTSASGKSTGNDLIDTETDVPTLSEKKTLGKGESSSSVFCRICHEVGSTDLFISPCDCKGSLSVVHKKCLERWLAESNSNYCELCGFEYNVMRLARKMLLVPLFGLVSFLFAAGIGAESVQNSIVLTDDKFQNTVAQHDVVLVMFMVQNCGSCRKFVKEMKKVQNALDSKTPYNARLVTVDCKGGGEASCRRYSVTGYPALKMFKKGKFWKEYDGGQTEDSLYNYMVDHAMPCPATIDSEEKLHRMSLDHNVFVGFFRKGLVAGLKDVFLSSASELRGHYRLGVCENPDMIKKYHPNEGVAFFRDQRLRNKFEPDTIAYTGNESKAELETWMAKIKHGLVGIRTPQNEREFKPPLIVAYYKLDLKDNLKTTMYWRNRILKVARKHKSFTFAISNKLDFQNDLFQFGFQHYPLLEDAPIVLARTRTQKFKMMKNFSVDALDKFVRDLKAKKLKPIVRSAKPPKTNDGIVKTVVGNTFESLVTKSTKDAFILFYVTDCRLCRNVKKLWVKLGRAMDGEDVDLFKMDVGHNDKPARYQLIGMPTAYWVPKNDKKNPVRYKGSWEYYELIEFIAKSATKELIMRNRKGRLRKEELRR